jgi:hypothetical protein
MPAWLFGGTRQRTKRLEKSASEGDTRIDNSSGGSPLTIEIGSDSGSPALSMMAAPSFSQVVAVFLQAALTTRALRRMKLARPYICRLIVFSRLT